MFQMKQSRIIMDLMLNQSTCYLIRNIWQRVPHVRQNIILVIKPNDVDMLQKLPVINYAWIHAWLLH